MDTKTNNNSRKLTAAEQRRLSAFQEMSAEYLAQGYKQVPLTMGIVGANVFAVLFALPFIAVFVPLFFIVNSSTWELSFDLGLMVAFLVVFAVLVVAHELIHGTTWALFAKNHFRDIEFGFIKEYATPYCTCKTPLSKGAYLLGAAMPCIVTGVVPAVAAVAVGSFFWLVMGLVMIMSAGGDAAVIGKIVRYRTNAREVLYCDHPTELGGIVFER